MENLIKQNGETLVYIALFLPVIGGLAEVLKSVSFSVLKVLSSL